MARSKQTARMAPAKLTHTYAIQRDGSVIKTTTAYAAHGEALRVQKETDRLDYKALKDHVRAFMKGVEQSGMTLDALIESEPGRTRALGVLQALAYATGVDVPLPAADAEPEAVPEKKRARK